MERTENKLYPLALTPSSSSSLALDGSQPPNISPWSELQVVCAEPW